MATGTTSGEQLDRRQWLSLVVLTVGTLVVMLDASVVNVALPVIVRDLGASLDAATWVLAGFVLAFAVLLLPAAVVQYCLAASTHGSHRTGRYDMQDAFEYEAWRRAGPVVRVEAPAGGPAWIVTDDALARQVLSDPRFVKDPALAPAHWHGRDPSLEPPAAEMRSVTTADGAEHRRLRRALAPAFTRRRVAAHGDRIAAIARDLLADLAEESARTGQPALLVDRFTSRYPLLVVCDLLGVPVEADRASRAILAMASGDPTAARTAFAELEAAVAAALPSNPPARDAAPAAGGGTSGVDGATATSGVDGAAGMSGAGSMVGVLAERARGELGDVPAEEFRYLVAGLVFAGQITTESFLGFLLAHQLAGHVDATTDADAFVAEALRLHPPAPFTLWRFAATPVTLAGTELPAGAPVLVDIEGIDTGPARCPAPHELRPDRPRPPALTFGDGPHVCLGAQLAQLEARTVIEVLRADFPDARLAVPFDDLPRDQSDAQTRRLASLPTWLRPRV